jgi:hypothetical protein
LVATKPERGRYRSQPIQYAADQIPSAASFGLNSANRQ